MTTFARLVGFCQGMPDVHTFVTPIFVDDAGEYVAQIDADDKGRVSAFQTIDVSDGFEPIEFDIAVKVGAPALFAFEMSNSWLVLGTASELASHLQQFLKKSPAFRESKRYTSAAIHRFADFASALPRGADHPRLFELMRTPSAYVPISMGIQDPAAIGEATPRNKTQWLEVIVDCIVANHAPFLDAHEETRQRVALLMQSSRNPGDARATIGAALSTVMSRTNLADGGLSYLSDRVCHECLFQLVVEYPTSQNIQKLLALSEATSHDGYGMAVSDIRRQATDAVQQFLMRQNFAWDELSDIRRRHLKLLEDSVSDPQLVRHYKHMMVELGIQKNRADAEDFLDEMRDENSHFSATTTSRANYAAEHFSLH